MTGRTPVRFWILSAGVIAVSVVSGFALALRSGPDHARADAAGASIDWTRLGPSDTEVAAAFGAAAAGDLARALAALRRAAAADSGLLRDGHEIAHALGRAALLQGGGDPAIVAQCTDEFSSGCYHGVIEAWVETAHGLDTDRLEELCISARSADRPASEYDCVHGLGHGLAGVTGHDLDAALTHCDAMHPDVRYPCHSGVFMEVINRALGAPAGASLAHQHGVAGRTFELRAEDPYYPCTDVAAQYRGACWPYQSFVIMRRNGFDFAATLRTCDAAPDDTAGLCYESFGMQIAGLFQQSDEWILARCALGNPRLAGYCVEGAAHTLAGMDASGERPLGFCARAPEASRAACFRRAGSYLRLQNSDRAALARICAAAGAAHAVDCRNGARLD